MSERGRSDANGQLLVGAAARDVTPQKPTFLYGYPHVARVSTGVHDPLLASAMYVRSGTGSALFVSIDTIWLSKALVAEARAQIMCATELRPFEVMMTATHTHSGPVTVPMLSNALDPVVAAPDPAYLGLLVEGIVDAAVAAVRQAEAAELAFARTTCDAIGSNRLDPLGPTIRTIPVIVARAMKNPARWLGVMYINPVHPTVLHEDSTLVSADFPGMCRSYLQTHLVGRHCPVLSHLGAAGNQSPRFVARSHSFAEAERLGQLLGQAIESSTIAADFTADVSVRCQATVVDLPLRKMPSLREARIAHQRAKVRFQELQSLPVDAGRVRTAECEVFGAEETVCLAEAATSGALRLAQESCLPAEVQSIRLGNWSLVGWPGEVFVELAIELLRRHPDAFMITLANGELQGYLVTAEAVRDGCYEALNAVFASPQSSQKLLDTSLSLLAGQNSGDNESAVRSAGVKQ